MAFLRVWAAAAFAVVATALPGLQSRISTTTTTVAHTTTTATATSNLSVAPSSSSAAAVAFSWTPAPSDQSTCGPPTFQRAGSGPQAPADWRHCAALFSAWASRNGTFVIHDGGGAGGGGGGGGARERYIPLLTAKRCLLGVKAAEDGGRGQDGVWVTVGDKDVKGILRTALQEWSQGTELGVRGELRCAAEGGMAGLQWQIYGDPGA